MIVQVFGQQGTLGAAVLRQLPGSEILFEDRSADLELVTPGHIHADVVINVSIAHLYGGYKCCAY